MPETLAIHGLLRWSAAPVGVPSPAKTPLGSRYSFGGQLRGRRPPRLEQVLEAGDRFFDLTIGIDLGYWDSLIVASKDDLSAEVAAAARRFERAVEHYESRVDQTTTVPALLDELALLAAGRTSTATGG
jgi:hypothetical protein